MVSRLFDSGISRCNVEHSKAFLLALVVDIAHGSRGPRNLKQSPLNAPNLPIDIILLLSDTFRVTQIFSI
jgi:hypothetical protein